MDAFTFLSNSSSVMLPYDTRAAISSPNSYAIDIPIFKRSMHVS